MGKISDNSGANRSKVSITEHNVLVAHGQSKKLANIRKKLQADLPIETKPLPDNQLPHGLKPEVLAELNKARALIEERIDRIMRTFPEGKKNKLFSFRFGSVEALKSASIKYAFKKLGIDDVLVKMELLADMDFNGNEVKEK
jgi:hypothetical protein